MRKILTTILAGAIAWGLAGCKGTPNPEYPPTHGELYLDLDTPDLPLIESGSVLKRGWTAEDLGYLGEERKEYTPYSIEGRLIDFVPSPMAVYTVKCLTHTDQRRHWFTSRLKPDNSFSGAIYLSPSKTTTLVELKLLEMNPKTGLKSEEVGTFTLRIE